jgi:putative endonuclease
LGLKDMYYVYIVECKDGTLYTGWTVDLAQRVEQHNLGKGAKYTRGRHPVSLKYYETVSTKQDACRREYQIKQLSRSDKLKLIQAFNSD